MAAKGKGAAEKPKPPAGGEKEQSKASQKPAAEKPAAKAEKAAPAIQAAPEPAAPEQWVTLGSADDADPYRMLVTLTNKGAAVARIELSSPRYCDIDDRSGYLGHLVMDSTLHGDGCPVQVVGPGTPAAEAGLKPGDVIKTRQRESGHRPGIARRGSGEDETQADRETRDPSAAARSKRSRPRCAAVRWR